MGLTASDKGGQDFDPINEGMHHAICYAVYDLGKQYNEKLLKFILKLVLSEIKKK